MSPFRLWKQCCPPAGLIQAAVTVTPARALHVQLAHAAASEHPIHSSCMSTAPLALRRRKLASSRRLQRHVASPEEKGWGYSRRMKFPITHGAMPTLPSTRFLSSFHGSLLAVAPLAAAGPFLDVTGMRIAAPSMGQNGTLHARTT